ncbi:MAG: D-alanyl-D-alanine carboxypeptidase, partial [Ruminococcaceae bacterium]|nr:D-alanyl-D-alanine carboxypeptidase [Oscillospiraceae bacterium]
MRSAITGPTPGRAQSSSAVAVLMSVSHVSAAAAARTGTVSSARGSGRAASRLTRARARRKAAANSIRLFSNLDIKLTSSFFVSFLLLFCEDIIIIGLIFYGNTPLFRLSYHFHGSCTMKKIRFPVMLLLICLLVSTMGPTAFALEDPVIEGSYAVLLETNTDTVLYEKSAYERAYPASLTKMMTVLLAVEAIENQTVLPSGVTAALTNEVTASESYNFDQIVDGSTASILLGETMSLEDLLYCAMLSSANEACNMIAEHIAGSVPAFVEMMNQRAAALGCSGTHFANTHGLPHDDHYTTAWDLTLIAREAVAHPFFRELCSTRTRTLNPTNMSAGRALYNTNSLINPNDHYPGDYLYEGAAGIKTGFTSDAGYCLASIATREGISNIQLLSIVLRSPAYDEDGNGVLDKYCNFTDSATLFDWGFDNWGYREILKSTDIITEVPVSMGDGTDTVAVRPSTSIVRLLPNDDDLSTY